jgi:hypothetical protein
MDMSATNLAFSQVRKLAYGLSQVKHNAITSLQLTLSISKRAWWR